MDEIFFQITFSGDNGIFYVCFQPIKTKWSWSERQCICWACYRHSFHNNNNYHYCVSLLPASENSGCHSAYQGRKQVSWIEMWTCESHWFWWFRYIRVLMKSRLGIHLTSIVLNLPIYLSFANFHPLTRMLFSELSLRPTRPYSFR